MKNSSFTQSFQCAVSGFVQAFSGERNLKIDTVFAILALALSFAFHIDEYEWLSIIVCIGLVFGFEIMNTAVEAVVDLCSPEIHPLAKRAKDCAAGATLVVALASLIVGLIIFLPRMVALFLA